MTSDQVLSLIIKLNDTIDAQAAQIQALMAEKQNELAAASEKKVAK